MKISQLIHRKGDLNMENEKKTAGAGIPENAENPELTQKQMEKAKGGIIGIEGAPEIIILKANSPYCPLCGQPAKCVVSPLYRCVNPNCDDKAKDKPAESMIWR